MTLIASDSTAKSANKEGFLRFERAFSHHRYAEPVQRTCVQPMHQGAWIICILGRYVARTTGKRQLSGLPELPKSISCNWIGVDWSISLMIVEKDFHFVPPVGLGFSS